MIEDLPLQTQEKILQVIYCASSLLKKLGKQNYRGPVVEVTTTRGSCFITRFLDINGDNLVFSDHLGHVRLLKMSFLEDIIIVNIDLIKLSRSLNEHRS